MDARFYNSEEINIERLATDLENIYRAQGYQVQQLGGKDQIAVQLKKGGDLEKLVGMGVALSVVIQRNAGGVIAMIGQQQWVDKAAAGAVGAVGLVVPILLPLAVTAGVGAIRQASLGNQVLNVVDNLVRQQRPDIQAGPIPVQLMPQIQQQWAPPSYSPPPPVYTPPVQYIPPQPQPVMQQPAAAQQAAPAPAKLRCPNCNTPYDAGDTFCTGCGKSLKVICPNCKTELKPDASFCPNCGASTFQTLSTTQPSVPVHPASPAPSTPVYTPPAPTYTPPTPTYTPPPTPVYKPSTPAYTPPTQSAPPKPKPPEPQPYVPPTPQEPPVVPKPRVTMVPGAPKEQAATPKPPQQPPPAPLYIPSNQAATPTSPTQASTIKPATPPQPIKARPRSEPAFDPNAVWGHLLFADGRQLNLSGERVVVGRYDHDLGGINPEVDLAAMEGAETVSRVHAALEHIGSAYTLMDLNSTNATRINGKRLEPDKATPIADGDTLSFGKVTCTFKKA